MCLAVPGRVVEITRDGGLLTALVDFGGIRKRACLEYVPDAKVGEYVIVHVGFALSRLDAAEAEKLLALLDELGELQAEGTS